MARFVTARWRYRVRFVGQIGTLCTQALRRAGYAPGAVPRAVLVLTTWAVLLATATLYLVRR